MAQLFKIFKSQLYRHINKTDTIFIRHASTRKHKKEETVSMFYIAYIRF